MRKAPTIIADRRWGRNGAVLVLLCSAGLCSLASNSPEPEDPYGACCECLARSNNAFSEPCITESTTRCSEQLGGGENVPTSSYCLREVCGQPCREFASEVVTQARLEACCGCLDTAVDPGHGDCLDTDAETCVSNLDNGNRVRSTQLCFGDLCEGECGFLSLAQSADGGVVDGG